MSRGELPFWGEGVRSKWGSVTLGETSFLGEGIRAKLGAVTLGDALGRGEAETVGDAHSLGEGSLLGVAGRGDSVARGVEDSTTDSIEMEILAVIFGVKGVFALGVV